MSDLAIVAEDLAKNFGAVEALGGVSLEVPAGSVLGLLGPNGAGKTTTVRILTTLLKPDRGRATVLGIDVAKDPMAVRASIGLTGQYAAVDENLTARENLRLFGRLTHMKSAAIARRTDELLKQFRLEEAANRLLRTYSGGMRRRLDLAAALVHNPPVLFLDEPTTGLDPQGRTELWEVIEELVAQGTTVLLTTQYLEEADTLAKRIIVIDHGVVIADGTSSELKARFGSTIFTFQMSDAESAGRAAGLLAPLGVAEADGASLALTAADEGSAMLQAVRLLDAAGLSPTHVTVREPSLDDVFLTLTGHTAEAAPPTDATAAKTTKRSRS
ncbi:MAG: transporter [Acidimicrobiia bacterium]|nr:transporter [Acidimicrobiia bacterium]